VKPVVINAGTLFNRTPPHSEESEMCLIGAMVSKSAIIEEVTTLVEAEDFYTDANRAIFDSLVFVYRSLGEVDITTLVHDLERSDKLADVGGIAHIQACCEGCPGAYGFKLWTTTIKNTARLRRIINGCTTTVYDCYHADRDVEASDIAQSGMDRIALAARDIDTGGECTLADASRELLEQIDRGESEVEKTGIYWFDEMFGGIPKQGVVTFIGQNGHGKSTLALSLMIHLAITNGGGGIIHSVEQGSRRVSGTILSILSGLNVHSWLNTGYKPNDVERLAIAQSQATLNTSGITIISDSMDAAQVYRRACVAKRAGIRRVLVDYVQDLKPMAETRNDAERMSESMRTLARIPNELGMTLFVVSQMTLESRRQKKTPTLNDGRGSAAISDRTDLGLSIFRPEFDLKPEECIDRTELDRRRATTEITVVKNKYGKHGMVSVRFDGKSMRFRKDDYETPTCGPVNHARRSGSNHDAVGTPHQAAWGGYDEGGMDELPA